MNKNKQYRDPERCKSCRGQCCLIYLDVLDGGSKPTDVSFEEHVSMWDKVFEKFGTDKIEPFFNPLEVHMDGNEPMRIALLARGINPYLCKYCGQDGCILPWENRPLTCREYRCQKWEEEIP